MIIDFDLPLPEFGSPPVVETVLSVQFEKLRGFRSVHAGLLWNRMREQFPRTKEHTALDPVIERKTGEEPLSAKFRLEMQDDRFPERFWFISHDDSELVQVQNTRFIKNWRKRNQGEEYPRYVASIKPAFLRDFKIFQDFIVEQELGGLKVNQCEVTYVNHIVAGEGCDTFRDIDKIFTFWRNLPGKSHPGSPEDFALHTRFPIELPGGEFVGRLHLDVQPALRASDNQPMYVMNLTARGKTDTDLGFLDIGHRCVVTSFVALTTAEMHSIWGKK